MTGYPIPATLPVTPPLLPPRQQPDPWPGFKIRHAADHTTHRAANGDATDREEGDTPC